MRGGVLLAQPLLYSACLLTVSSICSPSCSSTHTASSHCTAHLFVVPPSPTLSSAVVGGSSSLLHICGKLTGRVISPALSTVLHGCCLLLGSISLCPSPQLSCSAILPAALQGSVVLAVLFPSPLAYRTEAVAPLFCVAAHTQWGGLRAEECCLRKHQVPQVWRKISLLSTWNWCWDLKICKGGCAENWICWWCITFVSYPSLRAVHT